MKEYGCLRLPSKCEKAASFESFFGESRLGEHVGWVEIALDVLDANLTVGTLKVGTKPVVADSNVLGMRCQAWWVCGCKGNTGLVIFEDGGDAAFTRKGERHHFGDMEVQVA